MSDAALDPIRLGLLWRRLDGIVDQVAETFLRAAFSVVVRDNYDMAFSLFDASGRQLTQSRRSIPSFLGTLPRTLDAIRERFPADRLAPGDTLISNDAWIGTGHLNDISMVHPIFRSGRLIAYAASTAHSVDIGGAPSPTARDCYEEGLCIPICKIVAGGEEVAVVTDFLLANLRQPDETLGDVRAQLAAYSECEHKLARLMDDEGLDSLQDLGDGIVQRSQRSMRAAIAALPDGRYEDAFTIDGVDQPLRVCCAVEVKGDHLGVDFNGTSAQVNWPINSVLNYTQAYACYALKCLLDPEAPVNSGTLAPLTVTAPPGCLLNATPPAPVWGRHLSGHYVPPAIFGALAPVLPHKVVAESGSPLWNVYFAGSDTHGKRFVKMFFMNGGHGARPTGDGPGCLSFPSNVSNQPIEAFEHQVPLLATEKSLVPDTGGAGRYRGGNAQRIGFRCLGTGPMTMTIRHERVSYPPRGLLGGLPGSAGWDRVNGQPIAAKSRTELQPGDLVEFQTLVVAGCTRRRSEIPPPWSAIASVAWPVLESAMTGESANGGWRVGVDIGGTFTDVVLWQPGSNLLVREKLLTTPDNPARAVLEGIARALERRGIPAARLERVIHGTTLVANALIERKGVPTALITTRGFRDVLEIGREWRYDLFNLDIEMPQPLVPRPLRLEVHERMDAAGQVVEPLRMDSVERAISTLREAGVESVAVCLLHAYGNPVHEQQVGDALARALPGISVSLSSDVSPELGEYERTSTTVANAYVHPLFRGYVRRLVAALEELGFARDLLLVLSDGRLVRADVATRYPIRLVQSGPAAGAEAARVFGELAGERDVLCFDMGGTTAKACLIPDGQPERTVHFEVARETRFAAGSGLPLQIPAIDMIEIGAGGGSIARLDARGLLQVGPDSAGAAPGPACYDRGNTLPTVTDCDLVLGYLDAGSFLGGRMILDRDAAQAAIREHLADPLGIPVTAAAWGVHETVTANMAQAATIHAIERAVDVTRFAMLPIGGAGPVHACAMARKMGIRRLVCPPGAGVASAIGMLASAISFEIAHAAPSLLSQLDCAHALATVNAMDGEATTLVTGAGVAPVTITRRVSAMLRYVGQGYEIETDVDPTWLHHGDLDEIATAFAAAYRRRYARHETMAVELLSWRVSVTGPRSRLATGADPGERPTGQTPAAGSRRCVWFEEAYLDTPVFARDALVPGHAVQGPCVVEETESTLVVPPDFRLQVDAASNLLLTHDEPSTAA